MLRLTASLLVLLLASSAAAQDAAPPEDAGAGRTARDKGLDWLTAHQARDGSWGNNYNVAVTSFACLAYLSARDEPFAGPHAKALHRGLEFLLASQKDGLFPTQRSTWIHVQGFATLALSEAYGRSLVCKVKPDLDTDKLRGVVVQGVAAIAKNQSDSGGWWYSPGAPAQHEGSTTVCAVQALVSADNYGIPIDAKVLDRGFDYLKKCQTSEGGFNYRLGDGTNMKEGTAGGVATLGLMKQFDTTVMINGYQFLLKTTPGAISSGSFPYYGHFYGCMGMQLLGEEFKDAREFREKTQGYITAVRKDMLGWRQKDNSFPVKGWMAGAGGEDAAYATAFASLILGVPEGRLSIYHRTPPRLPKTAAKKD